MIHAKQHIPNYVDGVEPKVAEVASVAELLALPWVQTWEDGDLVYRDGQTTARPFHRWSLSDSHLMCEMDGGAYWWVVADLTSDEPIDLPAWRPPNPSDTAPEPQPLDAQALYDDLNAVVQRACLQEGGAILAVDVIGTVLADIFHACPRRQRDDLIARLSDALRQGMKVAEAKGSIQ